MSEVTAKRHDQFGGGDRWNTNVRFPGASSRSCIVFVPDEGTVASYNEHGMSPVKVTAEQLASLSCTIFQSADLAKARSFFLRVSEQLWEVTPERLRKITHPESQIDRGAETHEFASRDSEKEPRLALNFSTVGLASRVSLSIDPMFRLI